MSIQEMQSRAVEIREKFAVLERQKYGRAWNNAEVMQSLVADIGDLMKLVMAKEGIRKVEELDRRLAHDMADCLWKLLILANQYGVDLEWSFNQTMSMLDHKVEGRLEKQRQ